MEHILSLSYGKDSLACLGAIEQLGWPLDRLVHAEVWATDDIPADLPPMIEFKKKADKIIKKRWGIEVEHICATTIYKSDPGCDTFEKGFYHTTENTKFKGNIKGWPMQINPWCNKLKINPLGKIEKKKTYEDLFYTKWGKRSEKSGQIYGWPMVNGNACTSQLKTNVIKKNLKDVIQYLGIAADEPKRFHDLTDTKKSPLVEAGWTEAMCREWCIQNDLLSPIYTTSTRGGCWFCHNQGIDQLRQLRHNYPNLWKLMLKWDSDSPVPFKPDGHTVHDFDRRFLYEDLDMVPKDRKFRWKMIEGDDK